MDYFMNEFHLIFMEVVMKFPSKDRNELAAQWVLQYIGEVFLE
jgi:hypothetical protein